MTLIATCPTFAASPADLAAYFRDLNEWCSRSWRSDLKAVVDRLKMETTRPLSLDAEVYVLFALCTYGEKLERQRRGQSISNGESAEDLGFKYMSPYVHKWGIAARAWAKQSNFTHPIALKTAIEAAIAEGAVQEAAAYCQRLREIAPNERDGLIHLDANFFEALAIRPIKLASRPPERLIFVACDAAFFQKFGKAMEASWQALQSNGACRIHFEILDPPPPGVRGPDWWHCQRFVRLRAFADEWPAAQIAMLDADLLFRRPADELFALLDGHDVALMFQPGRTEVRNQINASVTAYAPTQGGRIFLATLCAYIEACLGKVSWGMDQVALYCTYQHLKPNAAAVPPSIYWGGTDPEVMLGPGK